MEIAADVGALYLEVAQELVLIMSVSLELSGRADEVGKILAKVRSKNSLNVERSTCKILSWLALVL